jgi:hypothetical protein
MQARTGVEIVKEAGQDKKNVTTFLAGFCTGYSSSKKRCLVQYNHKR